MHLRYLIAALFLAILARRPCAELYTDWDSSRVIYLNTNAITGANVAGTVMKFPVLVRLSDSQFWPANARADGWDIRFSKADGTHLYYERERWDNNNHLAEFWVLVDTVHGNSSAAHTSDSTEIRMYWGKSDAADSSKGDSVFSTGNGFVGVWHFRSAAGDTFKDATRNALTLQNRGTSLQSNSIIGQGRHFDTNQKLALGHNAVLNVVNTASLQVWINYDVAPSAWCELASNQTGKQPRIWDKTYNTAFSVALDSSNGAGPRFRLTGQHNGTSPDQMTYSTNNCLTNSTGVWQYLGVTFAGVSKFYINGGLNNTNNNPTWYLTTNSDSVYIGNRKNPVENDRDFEGEMDEIWFQNVERSADWIKLCYENQRANQTLVKFGQPIIADTQPPTIDSVSSTTANGIYKTGSTINVTVTFSEPVWLVGGNLVITLETGTTDQTVIIGPFSNSRTASGTYTVQAGDNSSDLTANSVTLSAGTLRDAAGNNATLAIPGGRNIANLKAIVVDGVAPVITVTAPVNGAFINTTTVAYSLSETCASGSVAWNTGGGTYTMATGDLTAGSHTIPTVAPPAEGVYSVVFNATDVAGNAAATVTRTNVTFDVTPPAKAASNPFSPADNATGVGINSNLSITFNEPVVAATSSKYLRVYKSDSTLLEQIASNDAGKVAITSNTAVINPAAAFAKGTYYYVTIENGAFTDSALNLYGGIIATDEWNFTTECDSVKITASPLDTAIDENTSAQFTVAATGTGLTYQWQRRHTDTWGNIGGGGATCVISPVTLDYHLDSIRCVVTNACGEYAASAGARITVRDITAPKVSTSLIANPLGSNTIEIRWHTPESPDNDIDSVWVRYSAAVYPSPASPGSPVGAGKFTLGDGTERVVHVGGLTGQTKYFFALWLTDTSGNVSAADTVSAVTLSPKDVHNPIVVRGTRVDSVTVRLTIENYGVLNSFNEDPFGLYVDTIGVWYSATGWPPSPNPAARLFRYDLAALKTVGTPYPPYAVNVTVPYLPPAPGSDSTYFFVASPFWRATPSGDSLPPFDTSKGDEVMMFDTVPVPNTLTLGSLAYNRNDTTVTMVVGNTAGIDAKAIQLGIWYGFDSVPDFASTAVRWVDIATVKAAATYAPAPLKDALFAGDTHTVWVAIALKGSNHIISAPVKAVVVVGSPRPSNDISLDAAAISSCQVVFSWSRADSVRIWYGRSQVPKVYNPDPAVFSVFTPRSGVTTDTIAVLSPSTTYFFGLQVWAGGLWSSITDASSATAVTLAATAATIANKVKFDAAFFDTSTNMVMVAYHIDTAGLSARTLQVGLAASTTAYPAADTAIRDNNVYAVTALDDTVILNFPGSITPNTTYYVSIWVRAAGEGWVAPTDSSKGTFSVSMLSWEGVEYFKPGDTAVTAFGGAVILKPGPTSAGIIIDTLDLYAPSTTAAGFAVTGTSFTFRAGLSAPPIIVGIKYGALPAGTDSSQVRIYRDSAGVLLVEHASYVANGAVWLLTNNLSLPFIAMVDTAHPHVTFDNTISDVNSVLLVGGPVVTRFIISDNIANVRWRFEYGKGNETVLTGLLGELDAIIDTITQTIPAAYVSAEYGLRVLIIVSDGAHTDTINISRQVAIASTDDFITQKLAWTPLRVTAMPDDTGLAEPMKMIGGGTKAGAWTYDSMKVRLFRWYPYQGNAADSLKWVEYSAVTAPMFSFVPGRVIWVKTRESQAVKFGSGVSTSLRTAYEITLPPRSWSDISVPFKFGVRLLDVLAASGVTSDTLQYYHWAKTDSGYIAQEMYIAAIPSLAQGRATAVFAFAPLNDAYTVYNPCTSAVVLRIPPTPAPATLAKSPTAAPQPLEAAWDVWLSWMQVGAGGGVSRIRCGYAQGRGAPAYLPMAPRFGGVAAGCAAPRGNALYGHAILDKPDDKGGFSYPIRFFNSRPCETVIRYRLENTTGLPADMRAAVFNPVSADTESTCGWQETAVAKNSAAYRWVVVGSDAYVKDWIRNFKPLKLGLNGVYPNPSRGRVHIAYTVPYGDVRSIAFTLYSLSGRIVWERRLEGPLVPGKWVMTWDGINNTHSPAASGVYVFRMSAVEKDGEKPKTFRTRLTYLQ